MKTANEIFQTVGTPIPHPARAFYKDFRGFRESDIKAIQDEAFKAGMTRAAMEVARWTGTELANDILRMREKLP